jgi:hypothetical protein
MVPDAATAASGGSSLFEQYRPFAILKPKNRKDDKKGELCLVQSTRGRAALAGRFFLRMRHFPLMLHASAENRDWGVGCIESRSPPSVFHHISWMHYAGAENRKGVEESY